MDVEVREGGGGQIGLRGFIEESSCCSRFFERGYFYSLQNSKTHFSSKYFEKMSGQMENHAFFLSN